MKTVFFLTSYHLRCMVKVRKSVSRGFHCSYWISKCWWGKGVCLDSWLCVHDKREGQEQKLDLLGFLQTVAESMLKKNALLGAFFSRLLYPAAKNLFKGSFCRAFATQIITRIHFSRCAVFYFSI